MLVLTRKKDQSILIGDEVVLTVRDIRAEKVLLDVASPPDVALHTGSKALAEGPNVQPRAGEPTARVNLPADQALWIGRDIKVTIEGLSFSEGFPTRVRLGIEAPREIPILREEIGPK